MHEIGDPVAGGHGVGAGNRRVGAIRWVGKPETHPCGEGHGIAAHQYLEQSARHRAAAEIDRLRGYRPAQLVAGSGEPVGGAEVGNGAAGVRNQQTHLGSGQRGCQVVGGRGEEPAAEPVTRCGIGDVDKQVDACRC